MILVRIAGIARRARKAGVALSLPMRTATGLCLALGLLQAVAPPAAASPVPLDRACALPDAYVALPGRLNRVAGRISAGERVRILTIGSSSTAGVGASAPDRTYPARLAVELTRRLPKANFEVTNRGIGGEVVSTTAVRMRAVVNENPPDLVIWQVGTNDAVRGVGADAMATIVEDGIGFLAARGIDVMLMDPQFYPKIASDAGYAAVVQRIATIARQDDVPLFRRYDAMRYWAELPDPQPMLWKDAFHMNDLGYACVAAVLAEGIARRVAPGPEPAPAAIDAGAAPAAAPEVPAKPASPSAPPASRTPPATVVPPAPEAALPAPPLAAAVPPVAAEAASVRVRGGALPASAPPVIPAAASGSAVAVLR